MRLVRNLERTKRTALETRIEKSGVKTIGGGKYGCVNCMHAATHRSKEGLANRIHSKRIRLARTTKHNSSNCPIGRCGMCGAKDHRNTSKPNGECFDEYTACLNCGSDEHKTSECDEMCKTCDQQHPKTSANGCRRKPYGAPVKSRECPTDHVFQVGSKVRGSAPGLSCVPRFGKVESISEKGRLVIAVYDGKIIQDNGIFFKSVPVWNSAIVRKVNVYIHDDGKYAGRPLLWRLMTEKDEMEGVQGHRSVD